VLSFKFQDFKLSTLPKLTENLIEYSEKLSNFIHNSVGVGVSVRENKLINLCRSLTPTLTLFLRFRSICNFSEVSNPNITHYSSLITLTA